MWSYPLSEYLCGVRFSLSKSLCEAILSLSLCVMLSSLIKFMELSSLSLYAWEWSFIWVSVLLYPLSMHAVILSCSVLFSPISVSIFRSNTGRTWWSFKTYRHQPSRLEQLPWLTLDSVIDFTSSDIIEKLQIIKSRFEKIIGISSPTYEKTTPVFDILGVISRTQPNHSDGFLFFVL